MKTSPKPWQAGLLQALLILALSIFMFTLFEGFVTSKLFRQELFPNSAEMISAMILGTIILSFGLIVFAYPAYLTFTKKIGEGIKVIAFTVVFMITIITVLVLLSISFGTNSMSYYKPVPVQSSPSMSQKEALQKTDQAKDSLQQEAKNYSNSQYQQDAPLLEAEIKYQSPKVAPYSIDVNTGEKKPLE